MTDLILGLRKGDTQERPLNEAERLVLQYIKNHKGVTSEDVANGLEIFLGCADTYRAIEYLVWVRMDVERDPITHAMTAKIGV